MEFRLAQGLTCNAIIAATSFLLSAAWYFSTATFKLFTYVWWCFVWWISMIVALLRPMSKEVEESIVSFRQSYLMDGSNSA